MDNVKYKYRKSQSFWGLIFFMISFDFFMIFLILHLHFFNKGKTKVVLGLRNSYMFNKKIINKMKTSRFIPAVVVSAGLLFNSCIREEALNMEADIEGVTIANAESLLQTEPVVDGNNRLVGYRI